MRETTTAPKKMHSATESTFEPQTEHKENSGAGKASEQRQEMMDEGGSL